MPHGPHYRLGLVYLFTATFFTSTAGILLRWMEEAGGWTVLFWRSLFFVATLLAWLTLRYRRRLPQLIRGFGRSELWLTLYFTLSTITFVFALLETTVARVALINGLIPFVTALLGLFLLKEPVSRTTWIAMAAASVGIAVMMGGDLGGGSLLGDALSFACCLTGAAMFITLRRRPQVDKVPAVVFAGLLIAVVSAPLAPTLAINAHDLALCAAFGCLQLGVQFILITSAARHVPAAEVALSGRLSIVLAPLWAWLGVGEVPREATLIGGAFILAAVLGHGIVALRRGPAAAKVPPVLPETTP